MAFRNAHGSIETDIFHRRPTVLLQDFRGQKMAERLFQLIVGFFGVIGFIAGYLMQQFSMTIYSVLFGVAVSALVPSSSSSPPFVSSTSLCLGSFR